MILPKQENVSQQDFWATSQPDSLFMKTIPFELIQNFLPFLSLRDLGACASTCRAWVGISDPKSRVWRSRFCQHFPTPILNEQNILGNLFRASYGYSVFSKYDEIRNFRDAFDSGPFLKIGKQLVSVSNLGCCGKSHFDNSYLAPPLSSEKLFSIEREANNTQSLIIWIRHPRKDSLYDRLVGEDLDKLLDERDLCRIAVLNNLKCFAVGSGKLVFWCNDDKINIWDSEKDPSRLLWQSAIPTKDLSIDYLAMDKGRLYLYSKSGGIEIWDIRGKEISRIHIVKELPELTAICAADGKLVMSFDGNNGLGTIEIYALSEEGILYRETILKGNDISSATALAVGNGWLFCSFLNGVIRVWDLCRNDLKNGDLAALALPQNCDSHSHPALGPWSLATNRNFEKPPCHSPDSSGCFGTTIAEIPCIAQLKCELSEPICAFNFKEGKLFVSHTTKMDVFDFAASSAAILKEILEAWEYPNNKYIKDEDASLNERFFSLPKTIKSQIYENLKDVLSSGNYFKRLLNNLLGYSPQNWEETAASEELWLCAKRSQKTQAIKKYLYRNNPF